MSFKRGSPNTLSQDQKLKVLGDPKKGCKPPPIKKPRPVQPRAKKDRTRCPSVQPLTLFESDSGSGKDDTFDGFRAEDVLRERPCFGELPAELFESGGEEEDFKGFSQKDL